MSAGPLVSRAWLPVAGIDVWRWAWFVLLLGGIFHACWPTVEGLVHVWNTSDTYAHCWTIPPISLWLLYQSRVTRQGIPLRCSWLAPVTTALAGGLWFLGSLVEIQLVQQLALIALVLSAALAAFGLAWCRAAAFPLAFLFMSVPMGQELTPVLVDMTADFVVRAVELTGIPIYREGNSFIIPTGSWSVVSGCSGVRYLMATLTVGMLFAYLNYRAWHRRLIFIVFAAAVAIVANWLRAFGIVMIAHHSGMRLALGIDHFIYGWVFFGVVIFLLISVGAAWREPAHPSQPSPSLALTSAAAETHRPILIPLLCLLFIQGWPLLAEAVWRTGDAAPLAKSATELPLPSAWTMADTQTGSTWEPYFAGEPQRLSARGMMSDGRTGFGIDIAWFARQTQGHELRHAGHRLVHEKDKVWLTLDGPEMVVSGEGLPTVRETVLGSRHGESQLLIWQLDWVDGEFVADTAAAMLAGLRGMLGGRGNAAAALVLHVQVGVTEDLEEARAHLRTLLSASRPALEDEFRAAAAGAEH